MIHRFVEMIERGKIRRHQYYAAYTVDSLCAAIASSLTKITRSECAVRDMVNLIGKRSSGRDRPQGEGDQVTFDVYQSRRKTQYELVVPRGTVIATYDQWDGDWRRIRTTENPGQVEKESIARIGHYLGRRDGYFLDEVSSLDD